MSRLLGPQPPASFVDNGCTFWPDRIWGIDVGPACRVHDYHYRTFPRGFKHRARADELFYRNLRLLGVGPLTAGVMYLGVRIFGRRFR